MKIFVIGSSKDLGEGIQKAEFDRACEALGEALGNTGNTIILCSARETTADPYIVRGLNNARGKHEVILIRPDRATLEEDPEDPIDAYPNEAEYPNITFKRRVCNGGWRVVHLQAIRACDAVIAIGGTLRGTGTAIYSAEVLERAVIPIAGFGGAAEYALHDFRRHYNDDEIPELQRAGHDAAWAKRIVHTALAIARRNPFKSVGRLEAVATAFVGVMSIGLWTLFFLGLLSEKLTGTLILLLMLFLVSIFGTLLRSALRALGVVRSEWPTNLVLEGFAGLGFAFVIFILSQLTSIFLSTEPIQVEGLGDIQRLGLVLSILVIAAVLFLENAWRRVWAASAILNR